MMFSAFSGFTAIHDSASGSPEPGDASAVRPTVIADCALAVAANISNPSPKTCREIIVNPPLIVARVPGPALDRENVSGRHCHASESSRHGVACIHLPGC